MKILIVKTSALGDIIQCFPALAFLRGLFPDGEISWVVERSFAPLLTAHPYINRVLQIDTKRWRQRPFCIESWSDIYTTLVSLRKDTYDFAIDFQGNLKSGLLIGSVKSREKIGLSWKVAPEWPNTFFTSKRFNIDLFQPISDQYLDLVANCFSKKEVRRSSFIDLKISKEEEDWIKREIKPGFRIMVCMGSNWENKKLSFQTWRLFLKQVQLKVVPTFYFVWGNQKEREEAEKMHRIFFKHSVLLSPMSLPVWQQMMVQMNLIFSLDSGALHLAATTKTPTYSFFGPSSSKIYEPSGDRHGSYQGSCPYGEIFTKRCSKLRTCKSGACLKKVRAQSLFEDFSRWFFK